VLNSIDRELTTLTGTMNAFQARDTRPASVIYASQLGRTTYPPVEKTCRNVRLKHGAENMVLGRTLMPASAAKIRVALRVVPLFLLNGIAATVSLLGSFTGLSLRSAEACVARVQF